MKLSKKLTTVTPLSKFLAMTIFILFPFLGFFLGMKYQKILCEQKLILQSNQNTKTESAQIANPASVFCVKQGGKSKIITAADGSQGGQCIFSDGRKCEEWNFYRTKICK